MLTIQVGTFLILTSSKGARIPSRVESITPAELVYQKAEFTAREGLFGQLRFSLEDGSPLGKWNDFTARPATRAEYERVKQEIEQARNADKAAHKAAQEDPRFPYIRRFKAGDFEPWDKLTLEQLRQISHWLAS